MFVDNGGRVGIGTTAPAMQLHITGTAPVMLLQDTASTSNQPGYLGFWNNASAETAWMGFGTTGSPQFSVVNARPGGNISLLVGGAGLTVSATVGLSDGPFIAMANGATSTSAGVKVMTPGGSVINNGFEFIAVGPR